jgi:predicted phosphodiesterase
MRYAVFSDVHSNLEAFEAVLAIFEKSKIDQYIFLGDIVGYGADPTECIAALKGLDAACIAGNHDWACVGLTDLGFFNEAALAAVVWTQGALAEVDRSFLKSLQLIREEKDYSLVHGTLVRPEEFDYMTDGYMAAKSFYALKGNLCFVGHSHAPGVFVEDAGSVFYKTPDVCAIERGRRYIINDGSVGQPRDGDPRASFCIYDDKAATVEFKRVGYDIVLTQNKILKAGLPQRFAARLSQGR